MNNKENTRKKLFILSVIVCFITIFIYEMLTPMLMDDMSYGRQVEGAGNFFSLFAQEHNQYMTWTGRSVAHIMLRICMFIDMHIAGGRTFFNIIAAGMFTLLTVLIYLNTNSNKRYNVTNYILGTLLIWLYGISFGQTVLWETGACNYLFTTTIVMAMVTLYRQAYRNGFSANDSSKGGGIPRVAGFFILGVLSGWCNENTSGGLLLILLIVAAYYRKVYPWTISAIAGCCIGLACMVLAPGNRIRLQYMEESHSGLLGMAARFLKVTLTIKEEFMVLLIALAILFIILRLQGKGFDAFKEMLLFIFVFFATSYSLILTVTPQERAFFGAGIFLTVALVQGYSLIDTGSEDGASEKIVILGSIKLGLVAAMLIYMAFTYVENGANLARINREEQQRYDYLEIKAAEGNEDAEIPMLHEQFENRYTAAYECDVTDDWQNWNNMMIAEYYGFKTILGIDPDEWTEY